MAEQKRTMIQVQGLTKQYGAVTAVKGISFEVHAGEVLGFLGPNGAGKTTTMKILSSYLAPTSGRAEIAGYDVYTQSLEARSHVGYLPEGTPLYRDMTVLEYLRYVADLRSLPSGQARSARLRTVVEQCGLGDRLGFLIGELSKGFRQRVGLAQAILHEPDVLILDEPTSGLDPNQIIGIREVIKQIGEERTVIFSTHIMQEVQAVCSRVLIIANGAIVADGTPNALQQSVQGQMEILVEIQGVQSEIQASLSRLPSIAEVQHLPFSEQTGKGGTHQFLVIAKSDQDPRSAIFNMAKEKGFSLLELARRNPSLEEVFHKLTGFHPEQGTWSQS